MPRVYIVLGWNPYRDVEQTPAESTGEIIKHGRISDIIIQTNWGVFVGGKQHNQWFLSASNWFDQFS